MGRDFWCLAWYLIGSQNLLNVVWYKVRVSNPSSTPLPKKNSECPPPRELFTMIHFPGGGGGEGAVPIVNYMGKPCPKNVLRSRGILTA